jgi:hypothetical protein
LGHCQVGLHRTRLLVYLNHLTHLSCKYNRNRPYSPDDLYRNIRGTWVDAVQGVAEQQTAPY